MINPLPKSFFFLNKKCITKTNPFAIVFISQEQGLPSVNVILLKTEKTKICFQFTDLCQKQKQRSKSCSYCRQDIQFVSIVFKQNLNHLQTEDLLCKKPFSFWSMTLQIPFPGPRLPLMKISCAQFFVEEEKNILTTFQFTNAHYNFKIFICKNKKSLKVF